MKKVLLVLAIAGGAYGATVGNAALVSAAENKDRAAVKALLAQKANPNSATPDGTTALHWAAHWNDLELTEALLKAGADAKAANRYGVSPIVEAAKFGNKALVERLLKAGADANAVASTQGETVLMAAARVGNADAIAALLAHGAWADAQEEYRGQTALMWAAMEGHAGVIRQLLAAKASVDLKSRVNDMTAHKLTAGTPMAPIPHGGLTPLLFAARQGQIEAGEALLDGGADINLGDPDGNAPLNLALINKHYDFARMLLKREADPNLANEEGRAPLYSAIDAHDADWSPRPELKQENKISGFEMIRSLLEHGANANAQLTGASPIKKLAQDGGDRTVSSGGTAFMRAARSADVEVMKLLLDHHAEPVLANNDGINALMLASGVSWGEKIKGSEEQAIEAVKLCLEVGYDVNGKTERTEDTALHGAALRGANSIVKLLVEKGAKLDAKNKQGFTPLEIAMGKMPPNATPRPYLESTVELLKKLGAKVPEK